MVLRLRYEAAARGALNRVGPAGWEGPRGGSSDLRGGRAGTADARARRGAGKQSLYRDLAAATFAAVVDPGPHPLNGTVDIEQFLLGCGQERGDLCPLEGDRRAFRVMLVIAGGV